MSRSSRKTRTRRGHVPSGHYDLPRVAVTGPSRMVTVAVVVIMVSVVVAVVELMPMSVLILVEDFVAVVVVVGSGWQLNKKFHISSQHIRRRVLRDGQAHVR